jgi:hypothetical protein
MTGECRDGVDAGDVPGLQKMLEALAFARVVP